MSETIRTIFFPIEGSFRELFISRGWYDHLFDGVPITLTIRKNYRIVSGLDSQRPVNQSIQTFFKCEVRGDALLVKINEEGTEVSL